MVDLQEQNRPVASSGALPPEDRARIAYITMVISTIATLLIGIAELFFYVLSANKLFLIEGAGNLAWLVPDVMMLFTIRLGAKKADWKMTYGYRRIETVFLLFFSIAIAWFMGHILWRTLTVPEEPLPAGYGMMTVLLAAVIIVALVFLGRYIAKMGKKIGSRILMMDARIVQLDIASTAVLLISGICLIIAPEEVVIQTILTIIIGLSLIIYSFDEILESIKELVDANPSLEITAGIRKIVEEMPGIMSVSDLRVRSFGGSIVVEITAESAPDKTLAEAGRIASDLEERARSFDEEIIDVRARIIPARSR